MSVSQETMPVASLLRRLAAISYDCLLLVAVLFFASLPLIVVSGGAVHSGHLSYQLYLLGICFLYYGWQWTHGGQTLGMKAWRLQVVDRNDNAPLTWKAAALRFAAAILSLLSAGLGFAWALFDRQSLAWHDRLSGTRLRIVDLQQHSK
jgi:uncharacterized RDD family membrane protein YckC